ncbi:MAG: ribonuclease H family protein [Nannocystaceae bacterium]|nr:ribonuclease H family protein [Nannocystaceae bacterium]
MAPGAFVGKYYVVWVGKQPGLYATWDECRAQVHGFPGALYRSFTSPEAAARAWDAEPGDADPFDPPMAEPRDETPAMRGGRPDDLPPEAITVDAACSGNPGPMEYRGVGLGSGVELFRLGPMHGTNNLGEFLALVHGLARLAQRERPGPVFTDSRVAMGWVGRARVGSTLAREAHTAEVWGLVDRALIWLRNNRERPHVLKWPTRRWGEIPADFGRK